MHWQNLRLTGFGLFCISFFLPDDFNHRQFFAGAIVFVQTPVISFDSLKDQSYWPALVTFAAWLANLSVPVPRMKWVAVSAMLAVWTAYVCFFEFLGSFVPFYPWAIGITLVQVGNLLRPAKGHSKATLSLSSLPS